MAGFDNTISNIERLQSIQDELCKTLALCAFCVDQDGKALTKLSGNKSLAREMMMKLPQDRLTIMLEYVMRSNVEDKLVEEPDDQGIIIGTVSIKINKTPVFSFILFASADDMSEDKMIDALNLFKSLARAIYDVSSEGAVDFKQERLMSKELDFSIRKSAALQEIVRFLDSDDGIERIADSILRIACELLRISNAALIKNVDSNVNCDVIGAYTFSSVSPLFAQRHSLKLPEFIKSAHGAISISSSSKVNDSTMMDMLGMSVRAIALCPVYIRDKHTMTCVFAEKIRDREWSVDEIRFLSDVSRILQNIINRKIQKNSLAGSVASLENILNHVGSAIFVRDSKTGEVLFNNETLRSYFERELREGTLGSFFDSKLNEATDGEIFYEPTGSWFDLHSTTIKWVDGREVMLIALYDVTDKKRYQRRIEHQAKNDFLTGLYNRMSAERDLREYISHCMERHTEGYVIYIDVDNFKAINDELGHKYGDVLLKAIAHSMQRIDGLHDLCYRMGGDEFVIIVPDSLAGRLEDILDELDKICEKPWYLSGKDYYSTLSIGVASFPTDADTLDELIKKADAAMYKAKKTGKNKTVRYSAEVDRVKAE